MITQTKMSEYIFYLIFYRTGKIYILYSHIFDQYDLSINSKNFAKLFLLIYMNNIKFHSTQLKHYKMVELDGIEPTTPCLQSRCSPS